MVPAVPAMDVSQQLTPLLLGDASQRDVVWASSIKLAVLQAVSGGLTGHALCLFLLLRQGASEQVRLQLFGPASLLRFERQEEAGS